MQNAITHKIALFFIKGLLVAILLILAILCYMISTQYSVFSFFLVVFIGLSGTIGFSLFLDFRKIQSYNWNNEEAETELSISANDDLSIQVCKRYVNKATYDQIKIEFGLSSNEQITRIIRKRLKETM